MKKLYFLLAVLLLQFVAFGQVVNIPDPNFKNALLHMDIAVVGSSDNFPSTITDTNGDGEIDQNEASQVYRLNAASLNIVSLEGLQFFTNLISLNCDNNLITTLDMSQAPNLEWLTCHNNQLTSLNVSTNEQLTTLGCSHNLLTTLTLGAMALNDFGCSDNLLTSIDASQLTRIYEGQLQNNQLTSLSFPNVGYYTSYLDLSNNPLVSLSLPAAVITLNCNNTNLQSLDLSQAFYTAAGGGDGAWYFGNNALLEYVNLKNGQRCDFPFSFPNCPSLRYICVDEDFNVVQLQTNLGTEHADVNFSTYCSFNPGHYYNTITGKVKLDVTGDGCDATDEALVYVPMKLTFNTDNTATAYTNSTGNYTSYLQFYPNYNVVPVFENLYYTINPTSYSGNFVGFNNTENVDFCISPNGSHNDLTLSIIPITATRPGFDAQYKIVYRNQGTTTLNGNIAFQYTEDLLDFVTANPPAINGSGTLNWAYADLKPFESRELNFTLNLNSPMETPAVNINDMLTFSAQISPEIGDETYQDNHALLSQTVTGSLDPNDKAVSKQMAYADVPGEYLEYTIRFQNTGNEAAENVVVKDMLDARFDLNSLQIIATSHPCDTRLNDKKLEFIFEGINLPGATFNEAASHGYVTFRIKALPTVMIGESISNEANIFFDYNFPVLTNSVNTIFNTVLAVNSVNANNLFVVYPNPVKGIFEVKVPTLVSVQSIRIFNTLGQLVQTVNDNNFGKLIAVDATALASGTYFIEIISDSGKSKQKIIKL